MAQCFRPDQVMRQGSVMPAGCYYNIEKVVGDIARDFTSDPSTINQQYGPTAGSPVVVRTYPSPSPGYSNVFINKKPSFLARFFGAK